MAEIILPPEENEETPQAPELNIDKPTENSKVITIEFEAKKTNKVSTKDTNQQLYTTDTDAWFEFKETTLENANGTYSVVFRNRHDGSIFQRTGDVVNGIAYYKIPEQEIRHAGAWRGQLVYTLENGNTTAREFGYDVKGHILDGKDVREIVVEDFETLMSQLNSMKDNAELELADLVNTAERNELERQQFYESLVEDINDLQENYQELLDTGVLQTNINEKLEELEEEYAPKLTEVAAQLAHTATKDELTELTLEVNNLELGGTTIPTWIGSFDDYFSIANPDNDTAYYLERSTNEAVSKFLTKRKPKMLIHKNSAVAFEGEPIKNGLQVWVDSTTKNNSDVNKAIFNDLSGNKKNGVLSGFAFDSSSGWNDSLLFDGIDDNVQFNGLTLGETGFTFEIVYFQPNESFPLNTRIVNSNSDYISLFSTVGDALDLKFSTKARPRIPFSALKKNDFNHITATCDFFTGDIKLYLNGSLVSTATNEPFTFSDIKTIFLGSFDTSTGNFVGKQKSFRFYDRPLSDSDILYNYKFENGELDTTKEINDELVEIKSEVTLINEKIDSMEVGSRNSSTTWQDLPSPNYVTHRGYESSAPENTMSAFDLSAQHGYPIGMDLRETKDGVLVCRHDEDLSTRSEAIGNVTEVPYTSFYKDSAGLWMGESFKNETIPTFEQVLDRFGGKHLIQAQIYATQSDATYTRIANMIADRGLEDYVVFEVNTVADMNKLHSANPNILVAITGNPGTIPTGDKRFMVVWNAVNITQAHIDQAKSMGIKIQAYGASKTLADQLIGMGVDYINCADPLYYHNKAQMTVPFTLPVGKDNFGAGWYFTESLAAPYVADRYIGYIKKPSKSVYTTYFYGYTTKLNDIIEFDLKIKESSKVRPSSVRIRQGDHIVSVELSANGMVDFHTRDATGQINSQRFFDCFEAYTDGEEKAFKIELRQGKVVLISPTKITEYIYPYHHGNIGLGFGVGNNSGFKNVKVKNDTQ